MLFQQAQPVQKPFSPYGMSLIYLVKNCPRYFPESPPGQAVYPVYCTVIVWLAVVPLLSFTVIVAVPRALGVIWNCVALSWVRLS